MRLDCCAARLTVTPSPPKVAAPAGRPLTAKPQRDLLLGVLHRVAAVDDVAADLGAVGGRASDLANTA
jgi:hypothetical protein